MSKKQNKKAFDGEPFKVGVIGVCGGGGGVSTKTAGGPAFKPEVRVAVTRSRKGWQWAQIARNGSAGAISPKTYDTKSNAVRAARRQAALVGGVVEVQ